MRDAKFNLNKWTSRMLAGLLEFTILYVLQNYQGEHYPDTIKLKLITVDTIWERIKTPTLYSTISKMEEYGLIDSSHEIVNAKLKRNLKITAKGMDLLPLLRDTVIRALKAYQFDDNLIDGVKKNG